jgi:heavy metal efflux system protein
VLCLFFFKSLKPAGDNFLVRWLKAGYLWQLDLCLNYRRAAVAVFAVLVVGTACLVPLLGREFMPELEEGNLWIRGTFPINISLDEVSERVRTVREVLRHYPEVETVVPQIGRPDDGTDPTGFYNVEIFTPLKPPKDWPVPPGRRRPRTKPELIEEMDAELSEKLPGVDWDFSQVIRDNVMESLSGVKGENSVKIFGPDLDELERVAGQVKNVLAGTRGVENAGVFRIKGQSNLEFPIDRDECARWGVSPADVHDVIQTAVGGKAFTQMIEGEKTFDVTLRWPERLRRDEQAILDIPVDIVNHTLTPGTVPGTGPTAMTGPSTGVSPAGTSVTPPTPLGSAYNANLTNPAATPRRRLGDLVAPLKADGTRDPNGQYIRPGASTIYREQGRRLIAVKFGVRGRDLAGTVAEAQEKVAPLLKPPYTAEWSGEFQEMEAAERRLLVVVGVSLLLITVLLYLAFYSVLDALVVLANVVAMSLGGVWALLLTGTNFNISGAVGFISILGVAVMNGLLLVSSFNALRARGVPLRDAVRQGVARLVRPVTMAALAAIFGLLPAALSTRIGSQSQRPLAIVVVGGMLTMLFLVNVVPLLYSFYGSREVSPEAARMAH